MKEAPQAPATKAHAGEILDSYLRALEAGEAPDRAALLARHPDLAHELAAALDSLDFVHRAGRGLADGGDDSPVGRALGDYRLLREIGRGGMAVVYEAEQVSLGRRVALKVLPFAAVLDPKQLQRFKNEALAAAHLRHPHIVPVYGVGCERGVHYYAMQYVDGQSLAAAIRDMREEEGGLGSSDDTRPGSAGEGTRTPISSHGSNREPGYIRMAATLGAQAAEALDHAHQLGIVHRDVKPGNLLVDAAGTLWVTDFGLARSAGDIGLTITGELLGTIRYMSPEQALAKRVPIDHRTDVYSLAATLYEVLTLEPAFPGDDPHIVIQDIAFRDPASPRRLNAAVPVDLETVVLKAMSKDPAARYATAQEMADDLRRYLEDRPVLARRPSAAARLAKWSRRHRGLVAGFFVVLLAGTAILALDNIRVARALDRAETNLGLARDAVDKFLLEAGVAELEEQALPSPARRALLERALEFYETYLDDPASTDRRLTILHALHDYEGALSVLDRDLDIRPGDARRLTGRGHILWHLGRYDDALAAIDRAISIDPSLAAAHYHRGLALSSLGRTEEAVAARREAVRLQPDYASSHSKLGLALGERGDWDGAILAYREAIRVDPDHAEAHSNLGDALARNGDPDGAILECRKAIRLRPDFAEAYLNLGVALLQKGDWDSAILEFREAISLRPDFAEAHHDLGVALLRKGDPGGAIPGLREAIRLKPDVGLTHFNLGIALTQTGDWDGAILEFRDATKLMPDSPDAHNNLGWALAVKGHPAAAMPEFREAIRLKPDWADAHYNLGLALSQCGDADGAILKYREAIGLRPDYVDARHSLALVLLRKGDPGSAIHEYQAILRLKPDHAEVHCEIGDAFAAQGRYEEALPWYRKGHELGSKRPGWTHPSKARVESAERKAEAERRLDAVLAGGTRPRNALERIDFADILFGRSRYAEAVRMYVEAFAEDAAFADDLASGHRYNAACAAALASGHGGPDAEEHRGRALGWLRADLAAREKAASGIGAMLKHWKRDRDLAAVRDRIADLPAGERDGWTRLWADVDATLARATPPK